ncbi:MAG TPA: M15 family metallopeptidase, partial [Gemmatimonadales bacterium]|nr:M15 family metallopeptidase [Gemmatimonadales bacterium]
MPTPSRPVPVRLALLVLLSGCARTPAPDPGPWPAASAAQAESLLVEVRAVEPTILVEARYAGPDNFTGAPLPGYEANRAFLRREAAAALGRVQQSLRPAGLGLKVFDGYRPIRATQGMVAWADRVGRTDLLDDGYIARRSRHNLGLAVDLTLVELATGRELPMGTSYDAFTEAAHTANAWGEVGENRQRLVRAMAAEGFENFVQEWWHFSFAVAG